MQYSKLKTLLIYNILEKYSDEEHPLSTTDLISMLEEKGVKCERKSIYADIAALNDIGCDIITVTSPKRGFFMASRTFEIPEVMLLIAFSARSINIYLTFHCLCLFDRHKCFKLFNKRC